MTKAVAVAGLCAQLLCAGTVQAKPTAPQKCDMFRVAAWRAYQFCLSGAVAQRVGGAGKFDLQGALARCRHVYFKKWAGWQSKAPLAGTPCVGSRFIDNGDGTLTDNLSSLLWEKKTNLDDTVSAPDPHDADNLYAWSAGAPYAGNGTVFTDFLTGVSSGGGLAGLKDWRLPTLAELQSLVADYKCVGKSGRARCHCAASPCINSAFSPVVGVRFWSLTSYLSDSSHAWDVSFQDGSAIDSVKTTGDAARAVRGGL